MKNEDAVSPVVGVMLMLVVTIIIAAVVSAFSGGLGSAQKTAPQSSIDVDIMDDKNIGMGMVICQMEFTLLSGDSIPTKDLSIITYYTNNSGNTYRHEQTASNPLVDLYGGGTYNVRVPFLNDMRYGYSKDAPETWFGNVTWMPGDVLTTNSDAGTADLLGLPYSTADGILDPDFGRGSIVDVKILHIPSEKYIFDKEVVVK